MEEEEHGSHEQDMLRIQGYVPFTEGCIVVQSPKIMMLLWD
jgi:hypothetical protein